MKQMLYTASLERHMDTYFQGVRLDDYNQQYQLAQMRIVREGELMLLSQAEIQYKLVQLKTAMETNLKRTVLDRAETIVPPINYRNLRPPAINTDLPVTPMSVPSITRATPSTPARAAAPIPPRSNVSTPGTERLFRTPRAIPSFTPRPISSSKSAAGTPMKGSNRPSSMGARSAPSTPMYTTKRPPAIVVEEESKRSPPQSRTASPTQATKDQAGATIAKVLKANAERKKLTRSATTAEIAKLEEQIKRLTRTWEQAPRYDQGTRDSLERAIKLVKGKIDAERKKLTQAASAPGSNTYSPTSSEAPTESTSTTAQPSSPPKDKKTAPINFQKEKGALNGMIRALEINRKIDVGTANKLRNDVRGFTGKGATGQVNKLASKLMAKYDLDTGSEALQAKKKEIYARLDESPSGNPGGAFGSVMAAKSMESLNNAIDAYGINVLKGSGLKSKSKVSKRKV